MFMTSSERRQERRMSKKNSQVVYRATVLTDAKSIGCRTHQLLAEKGFLF